VNLVVFVLALYEAWKARQLSTEFQENDAIIGALGVVSFCGIFGIPVFFLTDNISVRTFILTSMYTIMCLSIQGFLFGQKYLYQRRQAKKDGPSERSSAFEKFFSRKGRQELALENESLKKRLKEFKAELARLRSQPTTESTTAPPDSLDQHNGGGGEHDDKLVSFG